MRVWISGSQGFTGRRLVTALQARGDEVVQSQVDCRDVEAVGREIADMAPEGIVHLAAISSPVHQPVSDFYSTNVLGTEAILKAAAGLSGLKRIVIASSATVYGDAARRVSLLAETVCPEPVGHYAISKYAMERVSRQYADLPVLIVRPFNYAGNGQSTDFLLAKVAHHLRSGARQIELGNLDLDRDFSSVDDIIRAYVLCLNESLGHNGVVNFCSGQPQQLRSLVETMIEEADQDVEIVSTAALHRGNEVTRLAGDTTRLSSWIGFVPKPLDRLALRQMVSDNRSP